MNKTILLVSTLDTKGPETLYLKKRLEGLGLQTRLMDLSMRGEGPSPADITPGEVAEAGGSSLQEIRRSGERARITNITMAGASKIAGDLYGSGKLDGVMGLGGSTGSLMATEVMRAVPFGVPKVMVSSTAALPGLSTRYIGTGDIALFHSVIEISGVTDLLRNVLDRAAQAMAGMVQGAVTAPRTGRGKAVAMTMLGPCEKCASTVRTALEKKGFQVIGFSAAYVRAGALLGLYSTPEQIGRQLGTTLIDLAAGSEMALPEPGYPSYFSVDINAHVARSLEISLPSARMLKEQLLSEELKRP